MRSVLRALPVLIESAPDFDPDRAPSEPMSLFVEWFQIAVDAGVSEPHAMSVSTVDGIGRPDARMLILKDIDSVGWHFAVSAASPKGSDLAANPVAALRFYWPQLVRPVRVRGPSWPTRPRSPRPTFAPDPQARERRCSWRGRANRWRIRRTWTSIYRRRAPQLDADPEVVGQPSDAKRPK